MTSETTTVEITDDMILSLDQEYYEYTKLSDSYMINLIQKANELGLQGKKITEIVGVKHLLTNTRQIHLITQ